MVRLLLIVVLAIAVAALIGLVVGYNKLKTADVRVAEALSGIDVELTRRAALIAGPRPATGCEVVPALPPDHREMRNLRLQLEQVIRIEVIIFRPKQIVASEAPDRRLVLPEREHLDMDHVVLRPM